MATNMIMKDGRNIELSIASKSSNDPFLLVGLKGVCLTDSETTTNNVSVDQAGVYDLSVKAVISDGAGGTSNSAVAIGDALFYDANDTPVLSKDCTGLFYGYALETITSGSTATINVLVVPGTVVGTSNIPANVIDSDSYIDGSIDTAHIGNLQVTTAKIAADAIDGTKLADDAVSLEHLDSGIEPSHVPKYAGTVTWTGGGASLASTVTGVASTDIVMATIKVVPSQAAYLVSVAPTTNTITFVLSAANTSNDAQISYVVYRAAA